MADKAREEARKEADKQWRDFVSKSFSPKSASRRLSRGIVISIALMIITIFFIVPAIIGMIAANFITFTDFNANIFAIILTFLVIMAGMWIPKITNTQSVQETKPK